MSASGSETTSPSPPGSKRLSMHTSKPKAQIPSLDLKGMNNLSAVNQEVDLEKLLFYSQICEEEI